MNRIVALIVAVVMGLGCAFGQRYYNIEGAGVNSEGKVIVNVTVSSKKKIDRTAQDDVLRSAVEGVVYRGVASTGMSPEYHPLVSSPAQAEAKAAFFNSFFNDGVYRGYATLVPQSLSVMKNKQTKMHEASGQVVVDRERLLNYLEECNVIQGFSDLW